VIPSLIKNFYGFSVAAVINLSSTRWFSNPSNSVGIIGIKFDRNTGLVTIVPYYGRSRLRENDYLIVAEKTTMPDALMYDEDTFVVLETYQPEQFMTVAELLEKLKSVLSESQDDLPHDLQRFTTLEEQAQYLIDTSCDLNLKPGQYLQWYAVRLEK